MKRRAFDPTSDESEIGDADRNRLPCRWCNKATLRSVLSQYGARCFECYEAFCKAARTAPAASQRPRSLAASIGRIAPQDDGDEAQRRQDAKDRQAAAVRDYAAQRGIQLPEGRP